MPACNQGSKDEAPDPIRKVLEQYFDFELESADPDAVPGPEEIRQLHRDLSMAYRRLAAKSTWLEVGAETDPFPIVEVSFSDGDVFYFQVSRSDASDLLMYDGCTYQDGPERVAVRTIHHTRIPPGCQIEEDQDSSHHIEFNYGLREYT